MLNSLSLGLKNVISETDSIEFFRSINLLPNSHPIQISNGEKVRVCYLISHLADTLESPQREKWLYKPRHQDKLLPLEISTADKRHAKRKQQSLC